MTPLGSLPVVDPHTVLVDLARTIPVPLVGCDSALRVTAWNGDAERLFGWTAAEVMGQPLLLIAGGRQYDGPDLAALLRSTDRLEYETVRDRKDGSTVRVRATTSVIRGRGGMPSGIVTCYAEIPAVPSAEPRMPREPGGTHEHAAPVTQEQQSAHAARAERDAQFRALFEEAGIAIGLFDAQGTVLRANAAMERFFGRPAAELVGQSRAVLAVEGLGSDEQALLAELLHGERTSFSIEKEYHRGDGTRVWGRLSVGTMGASCGRAGCAAAGTADPDGTAGRMCFVGMVEDITEQRRALDALRRSEARYRGMIERHSAVMLVIDADTHEIVEANEAAARFYGYSREVLRRMAITDIGTSTPAEIDAEWDRAEHEGRDFCRHAHRLANGEVRQVEVRSASVEDDWRRMRIAIVQDVTDRVRSEEQRQAALDLLSAVTDASPLAIVAVDADERLTMWNRAAEACFGWRADEVLGQPVPMIPCEQTSELARLLRREWDGEDHLEGVETRRQRKDGSWIDVTVFSAPLRDRAHQTIGAVRVFVDIGQRKRLEAQLRQAQKMEAVGRLAGGIAHDFNNLLTVVRAHVEFALEILGASHPAREDLEEIGCAADRAVRLTRQLLAFSRQQVLHPRVVDLNTVVRDAERMLHRLLGEDVALEVDIQPAPALVYADIGQLEQVLMNLAVNARDAMPEGGSLAIETRLVPPDATHDRPRVALVVRDTGCGMDAETLGRIFEPFFTTKGVGKGTGLGLSTVYGIVKQSDGQLSVESAPGVGTEFVILLPVSSSEDDAADVAWRGTSPETESQVARGSETVLVVEDEAPVRRVAERMLRACGYTVLSAKHGADALQLVAERVAGGAGVDVVLTDVVMPEMGAAEMLVRLREILPGIAVVAMSGYGAEAVEARGPLADQLTLLEKPLDSVTVSRAIRQALDGRRSEIRPRLTT